MFLIGNPPRRKSPLGPETAGQRERWRPFGWGDLRCRTAHPGGGSKFLLTRPVCQAESVTASSSLARTFRGREPALSLSKGRPRHTIILLLLVFLHPSVGFER